ncbi:MAG TPA: general secretion pathway protein GspK [Dissulfurispiraceae bacterium]|nr:general secretion pathway protein GspK [Dissulfurispiraceae bacterium]
MKQTGQKGIALMLVIWILAILMTVVLSVSYMTKVENRSTMAFKEGVEEKFLAEAGVERAAEEIMYRRINLNVPIEEGKDTNIWKTDGTLNTFPLETGTCLVRIIDESGKIDINKVPDIILKGLLTNLGVKDEDADVIVDSIEDWRDADDLTRLNGAESDYYMSLPVPYKAKNADFDSIEELLLVRGITPELLYGTGNKSGLADFITVYSGNGTINVNAAPKEVLMAIPGMTPELAGAVLDFRKTAEIKSITDFQGIVGGAFTAMSTFVAAGDGSTFTVESAGRKSNKKAGYGVRAVITVAGNKFSYRYFKSPWDMSRWNQSEPK